MPKISGREVISETTEKSQGRLLFFAAATVLIKAYSVPVQDLKIAGMEFPAAIFDVSMLIAVGWLYYSYIIKWVGDLLGFRLWYSESSVWSEFGTNVKLDKNFIGAGVDALKALVDFERQHLTEDAFQSLPEDKRNLYLNFKTNVELYARRLDRAGTKFGAISAFGHFYVWVQGFVIPTAMGAAALYFLLAYGDIHFPAQR